MKLINTIGAGLGMLMLAGLLSTSPAAAQDGYPEVTFDYGFVPFDRACSEATGFEIQPAWIEELEARIDDFRQLWAERGPALLALTVQETGKPFRQREMQATMSLCRFPSMSHPLLLNMRRYMASATDGNPRAMHMFVALVFHELLHTYVYENIEASALLEKYEAEPFSVKSHMHLMALLKNAYLKLGYDDELEDILARDRKIGSVYARAWEIVNELEDYRAFVDELKQQPPRGE